MIRAFLALEPDEATRSALAVQQFLLPLPDAVPPESFHLTLVHLGDVREPVLEDLHDALTAMRHPAFDIRLAGLGLFGGAQPRLAYAGIEPCDALVDLHQKIRTRAMRCGIGLERRRFLPHVTLGRFAPPPLDAALRLERSVAGQGGFRAGPMPVREFVLYESIRHRDGPIYDALARYPLG